MVPSTLVSSSSSSSVIFFFLRFGEPWIRAGTWCDVILEDIFVDLLGHYFDFREHMVRFTVGAMDFGVRLAMSDGEASAPPLPCLPLTEGCTHDVLGGSAHGSKIRV